MLFSGEKNNKLLKKIALILIFTTTFGIGFLFSKKQKTLKNSFNKAAIFQRDIRIAQEPVLAEMPLIAVAKKDNQKNKLPLICSRNDNLTELRNKTPQIAKDFNILSQLPLSGAAIYKTLKNPRNHITSCVGSYDKIKLLGVYYDSSHKIKVSALTGTKTYAHESFHAYKSLNNNDPLYYKLTKNDAVLGGLLNEALAVAYELVTEQEAKNHGINFIYNRNKKRILTGASDGFILKGIFHSAYNSYINKHSSSQYTKRKSNQNNAHYKEIRFPNNDVIYVKGNVFSDTPPSPEPSLVDNSNISGYLNKDIEAGALQAAGRAVVLHLMSGRDKNWSKYYMGQSLKNLRINYDGFNLKETSAESNIYNKYRDNRYIITGKVSKFINLMPREFLHKAADRNIKRALRTIKKEYDLSREKKKLHKIAPKKLS